MKTEETTLLGKLGEPFYMKKLFYEGEIFFRPLHDFAEMDESNGIGDKLETATTYCCPPNPQITLNFSNGQKLQLPKEAKIEYHEHDSLKEGLIYCMSMVNYIIINREILKIKETQSLERLGNYNSMVTILNCPAFIERLKNTVNKLGYSTYYQPVNYFPEKDIARKIITPFDKREKYSYQNEFRILIECDLHTPLLIKLGSLEDIATIVYAKPLN